MKRKLKLKKDKDKVCVLSDVKLQIEQMFLEMLKQISIDYRISLAELNQRYLSYFNHLQRGEQNYRVVVEEINGIDYLVDRQVLHSPTLDQF